MKYIMLLPLITAAACAPQSVITARPPATMKTMEVSQHTEAWSQQEMATSVQDWDRAAETIANGLEDHGLLADKTHFGRGNTFVLRVSQSDSMFLRQLKGALETEITNRGGTTTLGLSDAIAIDLNVDIVKWGGGNRPTEGIWQAKVRAGDRTALSFRQPFYLSNADLSLYQYQPPVLTLDQVLARTALPLHYVQ